MSKFIIRLMADSLIRINEKPFFDKQNKSIALELGPNLIIAIFDRFIPLSNQQIPVGFLVQVKLEADDIDKAISAAQNISIHVLSIISCSSSASVSLPKTLWAYDATPDLDQREYRLFVYDPLLSLSTRRLDDTFLFRLLEIFINNYLQSNIDSDRKERILRAITSFRRGLSDNDDVLTEFLIHWSSLETMDVVYREICNIPSKKIYVTCSSCKTEYNYCPKCGREDTFLKTQALSGIEDIFAILGQPEKYHQLRRLRNGIAHGFEQLAVSIETARQNLELVRKAVLLMIMRIFKIEETFQSQALEKIALKGKFVPCWKLLMNGSFDPGNVREVSGHPLIEAKPSNLAAAIENNELSLSPTWEFTPRNCKYMTFLGYEIYCEEGRKMKIEMFKPPEVIKCK